MKLFVLLIAGWLYVQADDDVAYFPRLCDPLDIDLIVCTDSTITYQVRAIDPENAPDINCDDTSSPEVCYFDILDAGTEDISISTSGLITYTPTTSGSKTFKVLVFDKDVITGPTNVDFDFFNMGDSKLLEFTVRDPDFPIISLSSNSSCILECSDGADNCGTCIPITCNAPYAGQVSNSTVDANRYVYSLISSTGFNDIVVLSDGIFYFSVACSSSSSEFSGSINVK